MADFKEIAEGCIKYKEVSSEGDWGKSYDVNIKATEEAIYGALAQVERDFMSRVTELHAQSSSYYAIGEVEGKLQNMIHPFIQYQTIVYQSDEAQRGTLCVYVPKGFVVDPARFTPITTPPTQGDLSGLEEGV